MECKAFHWIGQSLEHCDECGRPWHEHDGLHTLNRDAGPFADDWYTKPWAEVFEAPQ